MIVVLHSVACRKSALCVNEKMHCKECNRVYCRFIVYTQGNDVASVVWGQIADTSDRPEKEPPVHQFWVMSVISNSCLFQNVCFHHVSESG